MGPIMNERPPVIDYATPPPARRWWVLPVVRELIALGLWGIVLGGAFLAAEGIFSFTSHATGHLSFLGTRVESVDGKMVWTVAHAGLCMAGFAVARWHAKQWDADIASRPATKL
jgi:hypothetical protein